MLPSIGLGIEEDDGNDGVCFGDGLIQWLLKAVVKAQCGC
jgi:hypothetical protein